jgi:hypothetical protein
MIFCFNFTDNPAAFPQSGGKSARGGARGCARGAERAAKNNQATR